MIMMMIIIIIIMIIIIIIIIIIMAEMTVILRGWATSNEGDVCDMYFTASPRGLIRSKF